MIKFASTAYLLLLVYGLFDYFKIVEVPFARYATITKSGILLVTMALLGALRTRRLERLLREKFLLLFFVVFVLFTTNTVIAYVASGLLGEYYVPLLQPLIIFLIVALAFEKEQDFIVASRGFVGAATLISVVITLSILNIRLAENLIFVRPTEFLDRIQNVMVLRATVFGLNENTLAYLFPYAIILNVFFPTKVVR